MDINRREASRTDLKLKCHVASARMWPQVLEGYTENISRTGISVVSNGNGRPAEMPDVGELVTVEVELPANHGFARKCIHCQATVVRVSDEGEDAVRLGLSVGYMKFRDAQSVTVHPAPVLEIEELHG